jgi:hypothetical protein
MLILTRHYLVVYQIDTPLIFSFCPIFFFLFFSSTLAHPLFIFVFVFLFLLSDQIETTEIHSICFRKTYIGTPFFLSSFLSSFLLFCLRGFFFFLIDNLCFFYYIYYMCGGLFFSFFFLSCVVVFQQGNSLLSFVFESFRKFRFFELIRLWVLTENEWVEKFGFSFSWVL